MFIKYSSATSFGSAATLIMGALVLLAPVSPEAWAAVPVASPVDTVLAKGDRLAPPVFGAACSSAGWPHYEQTCQYDRRTIASDRTAVRIIGLR